MLRDNVIVHAVRNMHGGGKKKAKKRQGTDLNSSETDAVRTVVTEIIDKIDPEILDKLANTSEDETKENWRKIGQEILKQVPETGRSDGLKHSDVVHAVRKMHGGGKNKEESGYIEFFGNGQCRDGDRGQNRS